MCFFAHARTKQKEHRTEDVRTVAGDDVQIFEQMIAARSNSLLQWDSSKSSGTAPGRDKISEKGCVCVLKGGTKHNKQSTQWELEEQHRR